jgi:hypothetical protein
MVDQYGPKGRLGMPGQSGSLCVPQCLAPDSAQVGHGGDRGAGQHRAGQRQAGQPECGND